MVFYQQYEMGTGQVISVPLDLEFLFVFAKYYSSCSFDAYPTTGENMKKNYVKVNIWLIIQGWGGSHQNQNKEYDYVELIT